MSVSRAALVDHTNASRVRKNSRLSCSPFSPKFSSRKSLPTCTISLANVSANDLCINIPSTSSSANISPVTSIIPFPSSPVDPSVSKSDPTCLVLLRSPPSQPQACVSPLQLTQERRKRCTARLLDSTSSQKSSDPDLNSQVSTQPPRKRPRLHKGSKSSSRACSSTPELRFTAMVQRSVACGVNARKIEGRSQSIGQSEQMAMFKAQDRLLASRLRTHLLDQGFKDNEVIDIEDDAAMDVDIEVKHSRLDSVDMDIDVESTTDSTSLSVSPAPHTRSPSSECILSSPKLVAALLMRHRSHGSSRSFRRDWKRVPSPLAIP